jgi:Bacterial regulatory proteins, luxR family
LHVILCAGIGYYDQLRAILHKLACRFGKFSISADHGTDLHFTFGTNKRADVEQLTRATMHVTTDVVNTCKRFDFCGAFNRVCCPSVTRNDTKDIAAHLGISLKTAESHGARLMKKLDIHETASLVRYAIRRGLIQA